MKLLRAAATICVPDTGGESDDPAATIIIIAAAMPAPAAASMTSEQSRPESPTTPHLLKSDKQGKMSAKTLQYLKPLATSGHASLAHKLTMCSPGRKIKYMPVK